jgi:cell division septal protein FtsQ
MMGWMGFCLAKVNESDYLVDLRGNEKITLKQKGKAVPLQAWSGPEGSRKLRFPDLTTTV